MNRLAYTTAAGTLDRLTFAISEARTIVKRVGPFTLSEKGASDFFASDAYKALSPRVAETVAAAYNRLHIHDLAAHGLKGVGLDLTCHSDYTYSVDLDLEVLKAAHQGVVDRYKEMDEAVQAGWRAA